MDENQENVFTAIEISTVVLWTAIFLANLVIMTFIGKHMHAYRANRDKQGCLIQTLFVST